MISNQTVEERAAHLTTARTVRAAMADAFAQVRDGNMSLHDAVTPRDSTMYQLISPRRIRVLLQTVPGWGTARVADLLAREHIDGDRTWRSLGPNQQTRLLAATSKEP